MTALRIVFCGTPEFAVPSLRRLAERPDFSIEAVITQPDRPRGRGQHVSSSPVKEAALELGLHVYQPETIKSESAQEFLKRVAPDAVVIIAYGQIIPARLLPIPKHGWINLHASLLPKYRGAAPIQWAIVNGEKVTGVTTMQINAGLDTGDILLARETTIDPDETAVDLSARLARMGAELLVETLDGLSRAAIAPQKQDDAQASLAPILKKEDGAIHWIEPAAALHNRVRGLVPWPGGHTRFRSQLLHIWRSRLTADHLALPPGRVVSGPGFRVACGDGVVLDLIEVQLEGRKRMTGEAFANGQRLNENDILGEPH